MFSHSHYACVMPSGDECDSIYVVEMDRSRLLLISNEGDKTTGALNA